MSRLVNPKGQGDNSDRLVQTQPKKKCGCGTKKQKSLWSEPLFYCFLAFCVVIGYGIVLLLKSIPLNSAL